ncbi:hypothetical protein PENSPDRAFT_754848 [Peniophora sp. CONT]|nr:hypothetical protein PENSPDRAFT_754848 [Peniophora sp. CONT]
MSAYQGRFSAHVEAIGLQRLREIHNYRPSHLASEEDIAAVDVQLEEDIHSLRSLAARLMQYQNTLRSPLLQLPVELLQCIMNFAAEGRPLLTEEVDSDAEDSDDDYPPERGWLSLGHVSSHVRTTLLAMRELWASAICSTSNHTVLAEVLLRAGDTQLTLRLNEDTPYFLWPFALQNLQKAQHIDVKFFDDDDHAIYEGLCELQLPLLQALHASIVKPSDGFMEHEPPWMRGFDASSTHAPYMNAPNLRTLQLDNVFLPFNPSNLTTLILKGTKSYWRDKYDSPDPSMFLDMLRRCSRLHTLQIDGWIPEFRDDESYLPATISCLRILALDLDEGQLAKLWSHIEIAGTTSVIVDVRNQDQSLETFSLATRIEHALLLAPHARSDHIRGVFIQQECIEYGKRPNYRSRDRLRVALFVRAPDANDQMLIDLPRPHPFEDKHRLLLSINLHYCEAWPSYHHIEAGMRRLSSAFCLSQVDALGFDIQLEDRFLPMYGRLQVAVSECFPSVHTLCVSDAVPFEDNLIQPTRRQHKPSQPHFICPLLRTIYFPHTKRQKPYILRLQAFTRALEARIKAGGSPISALHISFVDDLSNHASMCNTLRNMVPVVRSW